MDFDYYLDTEEETEKGTFTLTDEFKRAIEENRPFGEWKPGRRLPYHHAGSLLEISGLIVEELRLPLSLTCRLINCSINTLFVATMFYLKSGNSFIETIHCVVPFFAGGFLARTVKYEDSCCMETKGCFKEAGITMKKYKNPHFGVSPSGGCIFTESFKQKINSAVPFDKAHGGVDLPPLPVFSARLEALFYGCDIESVNLSGWEFSDITNTAEMFSECSRLTDLNLSGWDVSNTTRMREMFLGCYSLTNLDLSGWRINDVTDARSMFSGCSSLTSLDLSSFGVWSFSFLQCMFYDCTSLRTLDLSGWDISNNIHTNGMFTGCSDLIVTVDASQLDKFNSLNHVPETVTFVAK